MLIKSIVLAAIVVAASSQVFARNSVTCSGGMLYIEQTAPDGSEICWQTNSICKGEWSYSWNRVKASGPRVGTSTMVTSLNTRLATQVSGIKPTTIKESTALSGATPTANEDTAAAVSAKLNAIRASDLTLFYMAPGPIVTAFKLRAGWPTKLSGNLVLESAAGPTLPPAPAALQRTRRYPPHGYPCLGCHPCGDSYCDNDNNRLTIKDLSPQVAAEGFMVRDGKIVKSTIRR